MSTEISSQLYPSALSVTPVSLPNAESHRYVPPVPIQAEEEPKNELPQKEMKSIVNELNDVARVMNRHLKFIIDENTKDIIVKIVDSNTDEVIKELPPAELQRLHKSIKEAVGILINKLI